MATLTIRGFDDELHARLRMRAARHGRSMEAEVRAMLAEQLSEPDAPTRLGSHIHARFAALGGADLELPDRADQPAPPSSNDRPRHECAVGTGQART